MSPHGGSSASAAAQMVRAVGSRLPTSFDGDERLYGLNLFLMTAFACLGVLMALRMAKALWANRSAEPLGRPVSVWRLAWLFAGSAMALRCGTEAMNLWAWDPRDPVTTARVLMAKRWLDPLALAFAAGWLVLVTLADAGMTEQLRMRPFPLRMWASLPSLRRPAAIVLLSLAAAVGAAATR